MQIGVANATSTSLSNTWPLASDAAVAGRDRWTEEDRNERRQDHAQDDPRDQEAAPVCRAGSVAPGCAAVGCEDTRLDHVHEAVHVPDRLHRAAEAVDEAGRTGHEALPAIVALLPGPERERDRAVRLDIAHGA